MTGAWASLRVLVWKDVLIDLRRTENLVAMFFFEVPRERAHPQPTGGGWRGYDAYTAIATLQGRTYYSQAEVLAALPLCDSLAKVGAILIADRQARDRQVGLYDFVKRLQERF